VLYSRDYSVCVSNDEIKLVRRPVSEEEIVSMLIDARSFSGDDGLTNDDVSKPALEVLTLPVIWEVTARASRSFIKHTRHIGVSIIIIIIIIRLIKS